MWTLGGWDDTYRSVNSPKVVPSRQDHSGCSHRQNQGRVCRCQRRCSRQYGVYWNGFGWQHHFDNGHIRKPVVGVVVAEEGVVDEDPMGLVAGRENCYGTLEPDMAGEVRCLDGETSQN